MKNVFKILGAALIASTMLFVACSKDDEAEEASNAIMDWTFGGTTYEAQYINATTNMELVNIAATTTKSSVSFPMLETQFYAESATQDEYTWLEYYKDDVYWFIDSYILSTDDTVDADYITPVQKDLIVDTIVDYCGQWRLYALKSVSIEEFDVDELAVSGSVEAQLYDHVAYGSVDKVTGTYVYNDVDDCPKQNLTMNFRSMPIELVRPSKGVNAFQPAKKSRR